MELSTCVHRDSYSIVVRDLDTGFVIHDSFVCILLVRTVTQVNYNRKEFSDFDVRVL